MVAMALVVACTQSGEWQNPDIPQDQWNRDQAACEAVARKQAEQDFALSQQAGQSLNYNLGGQWSAEMNRYSAQRQQRDFFRACMSQRGYRFVPAREPENDPSTQD
jgi:hypothetical protein